MSKHLITIGWDDVPHLGEDEKERMLENVEPHLRDARRYGTPSLGSGAIYPIEDSEIICDPFEIPGHFKFIYGLDVGWKKTAAVWGAHDLDSDIVYLWSEHYRGNAEPAIHAQAIRARADWITGVIDTAARGRSQIDGNNLFDIYSDLGLILNNANKAVESGIYEVWQRLSTGRLKIFSTLNNLLAERRIYRRDDRGRIVKEHDHLMDAMRYLCMGLNAATYKPAEHEVENNTGAIY